jgi:hypothetical protein
MELEILIRTSFGLSKDAGGDHFIHLISDKEDEPGGKRNDLFIPIPKREAKRLSKLLGVEISLMDDISREAGDDIVG